MSDSHFNQYTNIPDLEITIFDQTAIIPKLYDIILMLHY